MHRFWDSVIEPVLRSVHPRVIVEIGADKGANTAQLLDYADRHDAVVHVIDPAPRLDVAAWEAEHGRTLRFHRELSLTALPAIPAMDVVLIDGDHNWFTVFHELEAIDAQARASHHPFPVVLMHDVDWPYGRRDLYYDPDTIPPEHRHPYRREGLHPGKGELVGEAGLNAKLANAVAENTARNGVRTALEDFLAHTSVATRLVTIPGWHGLAVVVPESLLATSRPLQQLLDHFESAGFLADQCRRVERSRIRTLLRATEKRRAAKAEIRELRERLAAGDGTSPP